MGSKGDGSCQPSSVLWRGGWQRAATAHALSPPPIPVGSLQGAGPRRRVHSQAPGEQDLPRSLSAPKTRLTWVTPYIAISFLWAISQWESSQGPTGSIPCQHEEFISQEISACILPLCYRENTSVCFSYFSWLLVVTGTSPFIAWKDHRKTITSWVLGK